MKSNKKEINFYRFKYVVTCRSFNSQSNSSQFFFIIPFRVSWNLPRSDWNSKVENCAQASWIAEVPLFTKMLFYNHDILSIAFWKIPAADKIFL